MKSLTEIGKETIENDLTNRFCLQFTQIADLRDYLKSQYVITDEEILADTNGEANFRKLLDYNQQMHAALVASIRRAGGSQ